jgi:hypothetical protein
MKGGFCRVDENVKQNRDGFEPESFRRVNEGCNDWRKCANCRAG